MSNLSVEEFIRFIKKLPSDEPVAKGTQGYNLYTTQKDHWLGWLDVKSDTGTYQRKDSPNRDAKYVYNHIMEPKMLIWLISAVVPDEDTINHIAKEYTTQKSMASKCASIRKIVPWDTISKNLKGL